MKKIVWLFVGLWIVSSSAMAQEANLGDPNPQPAPYTGPGYFSLGAGTALIGNGFGTEGNPWLDNGTATLANGTGTLYWPAAGLELTVGLNLDDNWSLNLTANAFAFSTTSSSVSSEYNLIPAVRYTFNHDGVTPYITAGAGINFNTSSVPNGNTITDSAGNQVQDDNTVGTTNFVASGGAGLLFQMPWNLNGSIYTQVLYEEVFTAQGNFSYFPLTLGYQFP